MVKAAMDFSDRTDDRRFLFEEASGISKYKSRKKAAIRKLEATDADLLRVVAWLDGREIPVRGLGNGSGFVTTPPAETHATYQTN